jgi:hypothetical protein
LRSMMEQARRVFVGEESFCQARWAFQPFRSLVKPGQWDERFEDEKAPAWTSLCCPTCWNIELSRRHKLAEVPRVVNPWISTRRQKDGQLAAEFSIPEQRLLTIEERAVGVCTFCVYRTTNYAIVLSVVCVTLHVSSDQQCRRTGCLDPARIYRDSTFASSLTSHHASHTQYRIGILRSFTWSY